MKRKKVHKMRVSFFHKDKDKDEDKEEKHEWMNEWMNDFALHLQYLPANTIEGTRCDRARKGRGGPDEPRLDTPQPLT